MSGTAQQDQAFEGQIKALNCLTILLEGQILLNIWFLVFFNLFFNYYYLSHTSWSWVLKIKMKNDIMQKMIYGYHDYGEAAESKSSRD